MIKPFCDVGPKKSLQSESDENDIEYDDADDYMSDVYDEMSDTDKVILTSRHLKMGSEIQVMTTMMI